MNYEIYSFDLDLDPITLVLKLDLDIIKMYVCTSVVQTLSLEQIHRQTHTWTYTDGQTQNLRPAKECRSIVRDESSVYFNVTAKHV